jgi:hypothetical protein
MAEARPSSRGGGDTRRKRRARDQKKEPNSKLKQVKQFKKNLAS